MEDTNQAEIVSKEDRDAVELRFLRIQNIELQRKILIRDLEAAGQLLLQEQREMEALKSMLESKYGIDIKKDKINVDGTISRGVLNKAG